MNLRDLRYLVTVADVKNFTKAAALCHISQPTLSGQIKKLEETLGVCVFERSNKKVLLTETGAEIVASCRRILQELEQMQTIATLARDPLAGPFRLGAFPTLASYIFPSLVPKIKQAFPRIRWLLVEEKTPQLEAALKAGEIDAALLALPVEDESLTHIPLFSDAFYLAVPSTHPLAHHKQVRLLDIAQEKLLLLEDGHCLRDQALALCHLAGSEEEALFRATSLETLRQMVKAGSGVTLIPEIAVEKGASGIRYIPFAAPSPKRDIGLFFRKTTPREALLQRLAGLF